MNSKPSQKKDKMPIIQKKKMRMIKTVVIKMNSKFQNLDMIAGKNLIMKMMLNISKIISIITTSI